MNFLKLRVRMFGLVMLALLAVSAAAVIGGHPALVEAQTATYTLKVDPLDAQPGQHLSLAKITSNTLAAGFIKCGLGETHCSDSFKAGDGITLNSTYSSGVTFRWYPVIYSNTDPNNPPNYAPDHFCSFPNTGNNAGDSCTFTMPPADVTIRFSATNSQSQSQPQTPANKSSSGPGSSTSQNTTQSHGEVKGSQTSKKNPDKPKVAVEVAGRTVGSDEKVELEDGESLKLSGQTVPYGKVTLYLFSKPRTFVTTADQAGNWEYTIADIPAGEHHIEAEVTDPATEKTSERTQVVALSVDRINQIAPSSDDSPVMQKSPIMAIVIGALITAVAAAIFVILTLAIWHPSTLRKWRKRLFKSPKRLRRKR